MVDVSVEKLKSLIAKKVGDPKKLQSLIDLKRNGKKFSDADVMFLEHVLSLKYPPNSFPKTEKPDEEAIRNMLITTTPNVQGSKIVEYLGLVSGQAIMGGNVFRDMIASVSDAIGGRSGLYEEKFREAREHAIHDLAIQAITKGANAIVGVKIDHEMVRNDMMSVSVHGTAVKIVKEKEEVKPSKKN